MRKIYPFLIAAFTFCFLLNTGIAPAQQQQNYFPDQLMVQLNYKKNIGDVLEKFNADFPGADLKVKNMLSKRINIWLLEFDDSKFNCHEVLEGVKQLPEVAVAQFNHNDIELRSNTPDDPYFSSMWGLSKIDADSAWDFSTDGLSANGDTIVVAVIDGGFDLTHIDVNYWKNYQEIPSNNIDDDNNGYIDDVNGWNAYNNNGNVGSSGSHGTHVSGTVGARGNNGTGVTGVGWDLQVMVINGSSSNESTVVAAYDFALEHRARYNETGGDSGSFVVSTNSSFGVDYADPADYPIWCNFYDSLGAYGILSAGATANNDVDVDVQGDVPTACPSDYMIAVTNMKSNDTKTTSAGYGATTIDLGAPGTGIWSTVPGDSYQSLSGTSMATPHVAGAIGMMYSVVCPGLFSDYANDPAGLAMVMRNFLLNDGVDSLGSLQGITVTGGRLNLQKCFEAVLSYDCMDISVSSSGSYKTPCNGEASATVTGGFTPYSYQWSDSDSQNTATATGLCEGTYTVTITDAMSNTSVETVGIANTTGISYASIDPVLAVYPNPSNGEFKIKLADNVTGIFEFQVKNIIGQTVFSQKKEIKPAEQMVQLNAKGIKEGVYFLNVMDNQGVKTETIRLVIH